MPEGFSSHAETERECETRCLTDDLDGGRGVDAAALVASGAGVQSRVLLSNPLDAERAVGVVQLHPCRETDTQNTHARKHTCCNVILATYCYCSGFILISALVSTFGFVTFILLHIKMS